MVGPALSRYHGPGTFMRCRPMGVGVAGSGWDMLRFPSTATTMVLIPVLVAVGALLLVLWVERVERGALRRYDIASDRAFEVERLNAESEHLGRMARGYLLSADPLLREEFEVST